MSAGESIFAFACVSGVNDLRHFSQLSMVCFCATNTVREVMMVADVMNMIEEVMMNGEVMNIVVEVMGHTGEKPFCFCMWR